MRHPVSTYRQFSVQGATPLGLVVMLYDGAIATLQRAVKAIEANDIQNKCTHLNRVVAIIAQLEGTLNFELGGEVARTLKSFYVYARSQALKANVENSARILGSLIDIFATVREAWYQAEHPPSPSAATTTSEAFPREPSPTSEPGSWRLSA